MTDPTREQRETGDGFGGLSHIGDSSGVRGSAFVTDNSYTGNGFGKGIDCGDEDGCGWGDGVCGNGVGSGVSQYDRSNT